MNAKKILALVVVLVMMTMMSVTAFACENCSCCGCKTENECHEVVQTNDCGQKRSSGCEIRVLKDPYSEPNVPYGTPTSFLVNFDKYDWIEWEVMTPEGGIMPLADVLTWGWELYGYDSTKLVVHYATYAMSGYKFRAIAHYGDCCKETAWASLTVVEGCQYNEPVCQVPVCVTPVCAPQPCQQVVPSCGVAPVIVATGTYDYSTQTSTSFSTSGTYFMVG